MIADEVFYPQTGPKNPRFNTEACGGRAGQEAAVDAGIRGVFMEVAGILEEVARAQDEDDDAAREQVR